MSSFGIGGTNAHVILEQAPDRLASSPVRTSQLIVLSAKSGEALDQATANLAAALSRGSHLNLADVAYTLQAGRTAFPHRRALVGRTTAEVAALLDSGDAQRVHTAKTIRDDPPVVFLFPGGGSQYPGMGRDLLETHSTYRDVLNQCLECARGLLGLDLREVLFPADPTTTEAARRLERPRFSLPALFATELALAHQLMALGIRPTAMIGHSMGEYVAACLAGVFSPEQGVALVAKRGELFETLPEGGMLTVPLAETELLPWLDSDLSIGAINAPSLCMVSGRADAIADLNQRLAAHGIECTRIHIPVAAHSAMLDPILGDLEQFCRTIPLQPPTIPFVSNLTGTWIESDQATDPAYWVSHLRHTVRFADGMAELLSAPDRLFLEVGPGRTLAGLARQQSIKTQQAWTSMRHPQDPEPDGYHLLQAIGRLWTAGKRVDWDALHTPDRRQRVMLPTYPFERKRHWIDPITLTRPLSPEASVEELPRAVPPGRPLETSAPPTAHVSCSRADRLVAAIKQLLHEMSGVDTASLNEQATFLELGFESLFLTQANVAFHKTFKVRTTFRQLFEQTPTIAALAAFLDERMSPDAFPEPATPNVLSTASPGSSAPAGAVTLEVLSEQVQAIARQLQAIQDQGGRGLPPLETPPSPSLESDPQVLAPAARAIGPWKPVEVGASSGLTEEQRRHVARLVERYCRKTAGSKQLAQEQRLHLADPRSVSGFRAVWKEMVYQIAVTRSSGSRLWDVDGNEFIDVTMGFSVNLFGFSPDFVTQAIERQLKRGIEIGVLAPLASDVADAICEITGVDRVCFVNTGSEANMAAIRAARTVTGRERIAVFAGAYHGIFDEALVRPITVNGQRRSVPVAPGIPADMLEHVTVLDYGETQSIDFLRREGPEFAAVLVETDSNPTSRSAAEGVPARPSIGDGRDRRRPCLRRGRDRVSTAPSRCSRLVRRRRRPRQLRKADRRRHADGGGRREGAFHGRVRRRNVALRRRFLPGSRRHVLRRHFRQASPGIGSLGRRAAASQGRRTAAATGPEPPRGRVRRRAQQVLRRAELPRASGARRIDLLPDVCRSRRSCAAALLPSPRPRHPHLRPALLDFHGSLGPGPGADHRCSQRQRAGDARGRIPRLAGTAPASGRSCPLLTALERWSAPLLRTATPWGLR